MKRSWTYWHRYGKGLPEPDGRDWREKRDWQEQGSHVTRFSLLALVARRCGLEHLLQIKLQHLEHPHHRNFFRPIRALNGFHADLKWKTGCPKSALSMPTLARLHASDGDG